MSFQQESTTQLSREREKKGIMNDWYGSTALARVASLPYVSKAVDVAAPYVPSKDSRLGMRIHELCSTRAKPLLTQHADSCKNILFVSFLFSLQ